MMKKTILLLVLALLALPAFAERTTVTISPLYANAALRLGGVNLTFKTYDMQRYREGSEWNWTVNFCEVYANNELVGKINSEEMNAGHQITKVIGRKLVHVVIKEMPKVTKVMECRGPVKPCWQKDTPVTRAKQITLEITASDMGG